MEKNNFEKKVQQKMDELKIAPSESVWTNVEKRIGKKDKNRRLIFILFFLFLLIFYSSYWLLISSKNNDKSEQTSSISKNGNDSKATNKHNSAFEKTRLKPANRSTNTVVTGISEIKIKKQEVKSQKKINEENENKERKSITNVGSKIKENYSKQTNKEDSGIVFINKLAAIENENRSNKIKNNIQNKTSIDSISIALKREITPEKLISKKDSITKKLLKKQKRNQWHFGITFSAGTSLISDYILKGNNRTANFNAAFPSGNPGYYFSPSPIKSSAAFIAGAFIEKSISHKTKMSLGISYKHFSFSNKVGNKVDSSYSYQQFYSLSNNIYSSAINPKTYYNNFHFIEVPVSVKLQLNNNSKLPIFLNAGINISQLISTNALQFQSNAGLYYQDNSAFNKTEFGLSTGLSVTLFSQRKMPISFGPYFSYSATTLANKGLYNSKHFNFIGINTEILFQKK